MIYVVLVDRVQELLSEIAPGDRLDFEDIPEDIRQDFLDEFFGQGMLLSSRGIVGCVEICPTCDGDGQLAGGKECRRCEGYSQVVDWGRGLEPYRE